MKAFILALLIALMGCGGGDPIVEDDRVSTGPIDCHARPELCR